jgi:hypothetical protein
MPQALSEPPEYTIRDALLDNWDPLNTLDYDPNATPGTANWLPIHLGWYDTDGPDPQVSLTNFSEPTLGGGVTTYSGTSGDGSGPTQQRDGTGLITVHAEKGDYNGDSNAQRTLHNIRTEIERIIQENATRIAPFQYVGVQWDGRTVDTEVTPVVHQSQLTVKYGYLKTP